LAGAAVTPCEKDTIPLPQEGTEPPDGPLPELIRAPVDVEGQLELFWGKAPQRVTRHESHVLAWALGGNELFKEAHDYPLDLLDSYFKAPVEGEPDIALLKAQRPAFNETACARTDRLPGPGGTATDLDACTRASVLLEGEQNTNIPWIGCEQYATPCAPQPFSFSPSPLLLLSSDTHACGIAPGERTAPVQCAAPVQRATPRVTAWLPRPGIRTYIFLTGLPVLLSRAMTSYLALCP
jgi:hypothetical protein